MLLIKIGGGKGINIEYICRDIKSLIDDGEKIVLIHGASMKRDEIAKEMNYPTKTITSPSGISSVYTDEKAMDIFLMAYAGLTNKRIVASLQKNGINAVGLSGVDGKLWQGKRKKILYAKEGEKTKLITDSMTGRVDRVNADLIKLLLDNDYVPVVCPPALSENHEIMNTDNDWATGVMVGALGIEKMVVLFEAPGMLKTFGDESSLIKRMDKNELDNFLPNAQGRMKKKLIGAKEAFRQNLKFMYWGDGRVEHPVINALNGTGTIIS